MKSCVSRIHTYSKNIGEDEPSILGIPEMFCETCHISNTNKIRPQKIKRGKWPEITLELLAGCRVGFVRIKSDRISGLVHPNIHTIYTYPGSPTTIFYRLVSEPPLFE